MASKKNKTLLKQQANTGQKKRRWLARFFLKLSLPLLGCAVLYLIYLDSSLSAAFSQARYKAPALLYSRALQLDASQSLSLYTIEQELKALDYRPSKYAKYEGEYQRQGQHILLYKRKYQFPTYTSPAQRIRLSFQNDRLTAVESWPDQQLLKSVELEPQFIGRFSTETKEDRLLIGLEQVPLLLRETLLLVEDREFYHHKGVRPTTIIRALMTNLKAGRKVQGGSTITQQLVKNMYLTHDQTYTRKISEALMALILDYRFNKDVILEAYLNEVYFGQDGGHAIHGVALASQFYFGKFIENLTPAEIATLVGMIKGPSYYEPRRHPQRSQGRRDLVLDLMVEHDLISTTQHVAAKQSEVRTRASKQLTQHNYPDFIDLVRQEIQPVLSTQGWERTGLKVFTTFDPSQQEKLEYAARQSPSAQQLETNTERSMLLTEHHTGAVRALIGGASPVHGGFNRALVASRPVGSLIKPWVLAVALEKPGHYHLGSRFVDEPIELINEIGTRWNPQNFDRQFRGEVSLLKSLVYSYNIPFVRLGMELTPKLFEQRLKQWFPDRGIKPYPSLFLGALELNLLDINYVYGALAYEGKGIRPYSVLAVTTHQGEVLYEKQRETTQLFLPESAWLVAYGMQQVVQKGTARQLAYLGTGLRGKTGSTNDLRDSWFVSFDDQYVLTTWLGRDDNQPIHLTGSRGALPLAKHYWDQAFVMKTEQTVPPGISWAGWQSSTERWVQPSCVDAMRVPVWSIVPLKLESCEQKEQKHEPQKKDKGFWQRLFGSKSD